MLVMLFSISRVMLCTRLGADRRGLQGIDTSVLSLLSVLFATTTTITSHTHWLESGQEHNATLLHLAVSFPKLAEGFVGALLQLPHAYLTEDVSKP